MQGGQGLSGGEGVAVAIVGLSPTPVGPLQLLQLSDQLHPQDQSLLRFIGFLLAEKCLSGFQDVRSL